MSTVTPAGQATPTPATVPAASAVPAPAAVPTPDPATPAAATPTITPATPSTAATLVPDKYELKLPNGSQLQPAEVEKVASYAKERKLTQEQAQDVLNTRSEAVSSYSEAQVSAYNERINSWKAASAADKEIGGVDYGKNVELAHRAMKTFGGDTLMQELEVTGYGNHPEVVRVFARIGKAMGEGRLINPGASGGGEKSRAEKFYGPKT